MNGRRSAAVHFIGIVKTFHNLFGKSGNACNIVKCFIRQPYHKIKLNRVPAALKGKRG